MPSHRRRPDPRTRRRQQARYLGVTSSIDAFTWVAKRTDRINIIAEGDSWFAYPKEWLVFGPNSNLIDWMARFNMDDTRANILCRAANGDTAAEMMKGDQYASMKRFLEKHGDLIDVILFSGGGNDIVGMDDLYPILNDYTPGFSALDCIKKNAFEKKLKGAIDAYEKLVALRNRFAPRAKIVTHTYDIAKPSKIGAVFLWGIEFVKPWIYPSLKKRHIPEDLHLDIVKFLLGSFRDRLVAFGTEHVNISVVDTQGTLRPGNKTDWLNEIHPTSSGFEKIAQRIYEKISLSSEAGSPSPG